MHLGGGEGAAGDMKKNLRVRAANCAQASQEPGWAAGGDQEELARASGDVRPGQPGACIYTRRKSVEEGARATKS